MIAPIREDLDLLDVAKTLWQRRWLVLLVTFAFTAAGVTYALLATPWYRAEVLLMPQESGSGSILSSQLSQLGSLASLAGVNVGTGGREEPIALLRSRGFSRRFIEDNRIAAVLMADRWDNQAAQRTGGGAGEPDVRDAVLRFQESIFKLSDDKKTGLVTLAIEWKDPAVAANWANAMAGQINSEMRARTLREASSNVKFLRSEMTKTDVVSLQQSIARLLEAEIQKLMLASGNAEFAFRIVDKAEAPKLRVRPKRTAISVLSCALGILVGVVAALVAEAVRRRADA
jgi:uncharacterized protein involved in exopolysaccharide biosynthesis